MSAYYSHSDIELCRLVAKADEAAFAELFRRYDKRIYPFVLKMLKSAALAEEVTQEIFIKLWLNREKLAAVEKPASFILTVASRHTLDHIRKQLNERRMLDKLSEKLQVASFNNTEELLLLKDSELLISEALHQLPPQQKKVYILSRHEGLTNAEIASRLQLAHLTVRNHLNEALRNIRHYLQKKGQVLKAWAIFILAQFFFF
jgi:RNA polymerase sigma-70 factor (ECF subfamily)